MSASSTDRNHTPGPWRVAPRSVGRYKVVAANGGKVVGEASGYNEQADDNAILIAAAPDLLASLEELANRYGFDDRDPELQGHEMRALAAIKKAKRGHGSFLMRSDTPSTSSVEQLKMDAAGEAIAEVFRAILAEDFEKASRCLARAQAEHYGQKPWRHGAPEKDAIGNRLVYMEDDGQGRYSVHEAQSDGSHVRVYIGLYDYGPIRTFEARGPNAHSAAIAAACFVACEKLPDVRQSSSFALPGGGICIRFQCGRASLD